MESSTWMPAIAPRAAFFLITVHRANRTATAFSALISKQSAPAALMRSPSLAARVAVIR
jgi:hypothetical protein